MLIINNIEYMHTSARLILVGDLFSHNNVLYMRMNDDINMRDHIRAVDMHTAEVTYIPVNAVVIPADGELKYHFRKGETTSEHRDPSPF